MRIFLVDDHPIVRKGLRSLLEEQNGYSVVGEAGTGAGAIQLCYDLAVDVCIVDLKLPDMSGIDVAAEIKQRSPTTRTIILSMHANDFYVEQAFQKGADGYVVKDVLEDEIVKAIQSVMNGKRYLSKLPAGSLLPGPAKGAADEFYTRLTNREKEVFHLIVQGKQNKEIAQQMSISVRTVEAYRANIMRKLKLHNHAEMIHYAVQNRIA